MSDFPGEMTKQILSTPAVVIRSIKYSLMARGRASAPRTSVPIGSNSFEKASGWIRVPIPAAGMIPHILRLLLGQQALARQRRLPPEDGVSGVLLVRRCGIPWFSRGPARQYGAPTPDLRARLGERRHW